MNSLYNATYNPDVLSCIANLSNDEVFTPPSVANAMLDLLPQELFCNPDTKFLDPACKSGVFLREIAKRLIKGLEKKMPELQKRLDHIFKKQLYGIAITELTSLLSRRSLYCSKYPNCKYSVTQFETAQGNIFFNSTSTNHRWVDGKCSFCGASREEYGDDKRKGLEKHAYQFIHNAIPGEIKNMKFDVIIGNPPYQLNDSGNGKSAKPIYQHFVSIAKKLNPRFLVMIIPSRWFAGGKGLDEFRKNMLNDQHILKLVDYENFKDVFPGVDLAGGACYFLWDRDHTDECFVSNFKDNELRTIKRRLNEYETFIRQNLAVEIVRKISANNKKFLSKRVSSRRPFGMPTNYEPRKSGIPCWFIQKIGLQFADKKDVDDTNDYLNKWKFIVPKAPIAGQTDFSKPVGFYYDGNTQIAKPGECCTESFIILGAFNTEKEVKFYKSYIFTKIVRFLLLQTVVSQDVTKKNFCFVPDLEKYDHHFTDEELCKKWNITEEEWKYIDSRICDIGK